jgi:hypothetical protein
MLTGTKMSGIGRELGLGRQRRNGVYDCRVGSQWVFSFLFRFLSFEGSCYGQHT